MTTAHECFVEAGPTDVWDCFKTPIDAIRVGEGAGLLSSNPTLVDNMHGNLTRMNSKGPSKNEDAKKRKFEFSSKQ